MMRSFALLAAASLWAGCSSTGDALVVITVTSAHDLAGVQSLQTSVTANGHTKAFTVTPANPPFTLPPDKTFAIDLPPAYTGMFDITIDAVDADTQTLASGANMTTTSAGKKAELTVTLGEGVGDGNANLDGMNGDGMMSGDAGDGAVCVAMTCAQAGYGCGSLSTCGTMVDCGPCAVTDVHPEYATTGTTITLEGRFAPGTMVNFPGGTTVAATVLGSNRATVVVPATASAGALSVSVSGTTSPLKHYFRSVSFAMSLGDFRQNYEQTDAARPIPILNKPRDASASFITGETMVVLNGQVNGSPAPEPTIEEADISSDGSVGIFGIQNAGRQPIVAREAPVVYNAQSASIAYLIGGHDGMGTPITSIEKMSTNGDGSGVAQFVNVPAVTSVTSRFYARGVVIGSYFYIVGGATGVISGMQFIGSNTLERASINVDGTLGAFEAVPQMLGTARIGAFLYVSQSKLYVMGGTPDANAFLTSVEEAPINGDGTLGSFSLSSVVLSTDRAVSGVMQLGNALYVLGGSSTLHGTQSGSPINTIERSMLAADGTPGTFATYAQSMVQPRSGQPHLIGNYLYWIDSPKDGFVERASIVDPNAHLANFTSPFSLANPRWGIACAVVGKYLYMFGGSNFVGGGVGSTVSTVVKAPIADDGTIGNITNEAALTTGAPGRAAASLAVFGREIYVCGGQQSAATKLNDCEAYRANYDGSLSKDAGSNLNMGLARTRFQLAAIDGALYAVGDNFNNASTIPLGPGNQLSTTAFTGTTPSPAAMYNDTSPEKMAIVTGHNDYLMGGSPPTQKMEEGTYGVTPSGAPIAAGSFVNPTTPNVGLNLGRFAALTLSTGSRMFLLGGVGPVFDAGLGQATNNIESSAIAISGGGPALTGINTDSSTLVNARQQACGFIVGNNAYVIGGVDASGTSVNLVAPVEQATIQ
jgi:hypothetical protein